MREKIPKPHLITTNDIFALFDVDKVKGRGNIKRIYKCSDKKALTRKIFLRYLHILMESLVEGGRTFILPTRQHMEMRWRTIPNRKFKLARSFGQYADVDVVASGFVHYELIMYYKHAGRTFTVPIRFHQSLKSRLVERVNSGYKYC